MKRARHFSLLITLTALSLAAAAQEVAMTSGFIKSYAPGFPADPIFRIVFAARALAGEKITEFTGEQFCQTLTHLASRPEALKDPDFRSMIIEDESFNGPVVGLGHCGQGLLQAVIVHPAKGSDREVEMIFKNDFEVKNILFDTVIKVSGEDPVDARYRDLKSLRILISQDSQDFSLIRRFIDNDGRSSFGTRQSNVADFRVNDGGDAAGYEARLLGQRDDALKVLGTVLDDPNSTPEAKKLAARDFRNGANDRGNWWGGKALKEFEAGRSVRIGLSIVKNGGKVGLGSSRGTADFRTGMLLLTEAQEALFVTEVKHSIAGSFQRGGGGLIEQGSHSLGFDDDPAE